MAGATASATATTVVTAVSTAATVVAAAAIGLAPRTHFPAATYSCRKPTPLVGVFTSMFETIMCVGCFQEGLKVDLEALKERAEDASARAREAQRLADENRDKARRCPLLAVAVGRQCGSILNR